MAKSLLASDTTYSNTRTVPAQGQSSSSGSSNQGYAASEEESSETPLFSFEENGRQTFFQGCMSPGEIKSFSALGGYFISLPFRLGICYVADNFRISHVQLFTGEADMSRLPERTWRYGWGFGFGALFMPQVAGGMPFTLHFEALRSLSVGHQLRFRASSFGSILQSPVDFERTAFVENKPIGVQRDHLQSYSQSGYPFLTEKLWTNSAGLYLALGVGAVALQETINFSRSADYNNTSEIKTERKNGIYPLASLCIGRFASRGGGRKFHQFELRYQATWLFPEHGSSFPSDNAYSTHSLTWDWSWLIL